MSKKQKFTGGQYRRALLEQRGEKNSDDESGFGTAFRVRFYISLCLFAAYVLLDYTKESLYIWDSAAIYSEIEKDMASELDIGEVWKEAFGSVYISDENTESADGD